MRSKASGGEDLTPYLYKIQVVFVARGFDFGHHKVTDWYDRWLKKTGWSGHPWPPHAYKALANALTDPTLEEQKLYLQETSKYFSLKS